MGRINVDTERCRRIITVVDGLHSATPEGFRPKSLGHEEDLFFTYIITGICHQINWNFLMGALERVRAQWPEKFTPKYMERLTHEELCQWLAGYSKPWRLGRRFKRAKFVRGMCELLLDGYGGSIADLVDGTRGRLAGSGGLYARLSKCEAYCEDPLWKKASVFAELITRWGLAEFEDWEKYIPPIDYHICRLALRSGMLVVEDEGLSKMLAAYAPASEEDDTAIRWMAIVAIEEMEEHTKKSSKMDIQGLLWALGRDCCHEDGPHCDGCNLQDCSVCKYYPDIRCEGFCPLRSVCRAANEEPALRSIREQNFITTWY